MVTVSGHSLVSGQARGTVLCLQEPISFWGGVEPNSGRIIEGRHPQAGESVTGKILVLPHGRGSSSSPSVLAEMIRLGTAPAGVILAERDPMIVLGSLVASELYGITLPVSVLDDPRLADAYEVEIQSDGGLKFH